MKKVLFATSALVALSGAAYAEVAVTGDGRMGLIWDGEDAQFSSRARATFNLTGETDTGLSFGGSFRVDHENYTDSPERRSAAHGSAGSVFVSGTYGKLSMGDVLSAAEAAIGNLPEIGYTSGDFAANPEELDYLTGDGANEDQGPTALYEYTFSGVKLFASMTDGSERDCGSSNATFGGSPVVGVDCYDADSADPAFSLAAGYEFGAYSVALAYSDNGDATEIMVGGTAAINEFKFKAFYADYDDRTLASLGDFDFLGEDDLPLFEVDYDRSYGLSAEYAMANGVGLQAFWVRRDVEIEEGFADQADDRYDAYGIGASYDLGGGATLAGAIIKNELFSDDETRADAGIKFSF